MAGSTEEGLRIVLRVESFDNTLDLDEKVKRSARFILHAYGVVEERYLYRFPEGHDTSVVGGLLEAMKGSWPEIGDYFGGGQVTHTNPETGEASLLGYAVTAFEELDMEVLNPVEY